MYIPRSFLMEDAETLHDFIRHHSFATLVSIDAGQSTASHLPLLLDADVGEHGQLVGHMAKANSQWKTVKAQRVLCIFQGPHAYISPSWFGGGNVVPTWNYVAVHASGTMTLETDTSRLRDIVERYVEEYEANMPRPWSTSSVEAEYVDKLLDGIVGFTINIEQLEGKWKLNQNHPEENRRRVVEGLRTRNSGHDAEIASLMDAPPPG